MFSNNVDRHDDDRNVDRRPHLRSSTPACSTDCSRQDWCSRLQPDLRALSGLFRLTWSFLMDELLTHDIRNSNGDLSASDRLDHVSWRQRRPAAETEAVLCRCRGELIILIIITRPKPAYGRQGLDWIVRLLGKVIIFRDRQTNKQTEASYYV